MSEQHLPELDLVRVFSLPDVTLGLLKLGRFVFSTLELPWKDNEQNISCVPPGQYYTELNHRGVYQLDGVVGRSGIQIHVGNIASDIRGCILLGMRFGTLVGQPAVLSSATAIQIFKRELNYGSFLLNIKG